MRIFIFSYRKIMGQCGGSSGVNYRLYLANLKYRKIRNSYHVFLDQVFAGDDDSYRGIDVTLPVINGSRLRKALIKIPFSIVLADILKRRRALKWMQKVNEIFKFGMDDFYIFHDIESAYAFIRLFVFRNTLLVYHQQGGLYSECRAFHAVKSKSLHSYYTSLMEKTFSRISFISFPSEGARELLKNDEPTLKSVIEKKKAPILYNGFTPLAEYELSEETRCILSRVRGYTVFATVAALNYAKGVERIPRYLSGIKRAGVKFRWILVGNGSRAGILEKEIRKHGLLQNVLWIKNAISHDAVMNIMKAADYYILFHRWSIFDYSTIEAMSEGAVPILTPVGGNREVAADRVSGIFIRDFRDITGFLDIHGRIREAGIESKKFEREHFSEESFIEGYGKAVGICSESGGF